MKQKFVGFIAFLLLAFLLCNSYSTSARLLQHEQGDEKEVKAKGITQAGSIFKDETQDFSTLMGSEEKCNEKDEECLERRMIAEAHLDYIYTQHHKP